ncbi:MAG: glycosyltransferase family 4 protein [Ignavibacteriae bacterium]|nr:glycosyltransferase family 4 protein [Ignavibacteriota bacterium]
MKLAFVTDSFNNETGIGRVICALAGRFAARGHDVHVFANSVAILDRAWTSHTISPRMPLNSLSRWWARYAVPRMIDQMDFDVVNAFTIGRGANVVSAQSCHAAGLALSESYEKQVKPRKNFGIVDRLTVEDERALFTSPRTKKIIAVSHLVKNQITKFYVVDPSRICVIPNGVDLNAFSKVRTREKRGDLRAQFGIGQDDFVILFVGNEFARKGLHTLVKAIARLPRAPKLVVVGSDNPAPFRSLAQSAGVGESVLFVGVSRQPEKYFGMADAFVFPTLYEPFGIVIVEAMAAGLPVITSKEAGAVEGVVDDNQALLLTDPGSVEEVSAKVNQLIENKELRLKIATSAIAYAQKFSWDRVADETLKEYDEVA